VNPNAEAPVPASHEVGVVVGDAEIVDDREVAGVEEVVQGEPAAVVSGQQVADFKLAGGGPASLADVEGVFGRGLDDPPGDVQIQQHAFALEVLFDDLRFDRGVRVVFVARKDDIPRL